MSKSSTAKVSLVIIAAMLVTLLAVVPAFAAEAAKPAAATTAAATTAAPAEAEGAAEGAAAKSEGEAAGGEKEAEIPHVVGHPSESQLADLRFAWAGTPGYSILLVSILGMVATVGIIGFAAFKQSKI